MKDFVILVLVSLAFFAVLNGRNARKVSTYAVSDIDPTAPVPPVIIQAIIEKVQSSMPDMAPLETLFVNIQPDGSYNSRHMFYNTKHFYGTQYDVNAKVGSDGSVGIWHETYAIDPGAYENIYNNMPAFGLGKAGRLEPVGRRSESAVQRFNSNPPPESGPDLP